MRKGMLILAVLVAACGAAKDIDKSVNRSESELTGKTPTGTTAPSATPATDAGH